MRLGELETTRLLGKGGMSEVWEAENSRLGTRLAVKIYTPSSDDAELRARFEQEGRLLARLRHPRIVRVMDVGTIDDGRPYFVMDLVLNPDGVPQTLADVPGEAVDEESVARWYDDLRDGLSYVHRQGIVHRDIKLQNVMIGPDGHAVLTDFGISRAAVAGGAVDDPVRTVVRVRDGKTPLMGSVGYLAPEVELGMPASARSDWYALGVLVYRLLTGTWCDARTDIAATLETYDPAWCAILPKLLHANPAGRECPSFAETRAMLRARADAAAEELQVAERRRGRIARRAARTFAVFSALLAVAFVFGVFEFRNARREWRLDLRAAAGRRTAVPAFDELFTIPAAARAEEQTDADGNVTMPSRGDFSSSRVDALVLTQPLFSNLAAGLTTAEQVASDLASMADRIENGSSPSPMDALEFGGLLYQQLGEDQPLVMLLRTAAERLRERAETE